MKTFMETAQAYGLNRLIKFIDDDYEENIPRALDWLEKLDQDGRLSGLYQSARKIIKDPESNWHRYLAGIFTDIDRDSRFMLLSNLLVNASVVTAKKRDQIGRREDCNIPWAVLMDPTSACNLRCRGCWAAEYGDRLSLSLETLDDIIAQGKQLGIYFYIYSGGEPFLRKKDILALCHKHADCMFLAFTNGTLIDGPFAEEMARVRNLIPAISVEGFEEMTDSRRGHGTYRQVVRAMELLRDRKLPFGISTCYTSQNAEEVGSDAYIDAMIGLGAKFCWYFTYIPVGSGAPAELIASAGQREFMYRQVRRFREEKPIFILDFWNDGEYVRGCIAGGRTYLHINANGDVEPCAFIHYASANIHETTLLQALKSPLFAEYRRNQPFNPNQLRPCPLLDNPGALAGMVARSGAHSTDLSSPEDVDALTDKCRAAAYHWACTADRLWAESPAGRQEKAAAE